MKINFATPLLVLLTGETLRTRTTDGQEKDLTLKLASVESLLSPAEGETGDDMFANYSLAKKIVAAGDDDADITPEDSVRLKRKIAAVYAGAPAVVGASYELLNG